MEHRPGRRRHATVTAFDLNADFVAITQSRVGRNAVVLQADLAWIGFLVERLAEPAPGVQAKVAGTGACVPQPLAN